MNILIIKNDGFGDFILVRDLIKKIDTKKHNLNIVLSKINKNLANDLKNVKKYFFDFYGSNFSFEKKKLKQDKISLNNIKKKNYDLCIVLRRYLNTEQVLLLNEIKSKTLILCHQYSSSKINLKKKYKKIIVPEYMLNDFDYFNYFLKKIKLIKNNKIINEKKYPNHKYLVLNLSGEKQFKKIDNLEILLKIIRKNYNHKIYIIGKTLDKNIDYQIKKRIKILKIHNSFNLWSKTNFKNSMKIINNCEFYIGFDTGLSHYSCMINKKSLIILNSGGANKWFPYSKSLKKNISYWIYNTPCSGCNFSGGLNKCFYEIRYCIDNIFQNPKLVEMKFINFINKKKDEFINFSNNNFITPDWSMGYKKNNFKIISKNGSLITSKSFKINFYKILQKFGYLIFNQKNFFLSVKIIIINFMTIFYQFIKR